MSNNSPFQSKDAEKIIMGFIQNELFPVINRLKDLNERVLSHKANLLTSYYSINLKTLIEEHQNLSTGFFVVYKKFTTPDILFDSLKGKEDKTHIADYFNWQKVVKETLNEGFMLLEVSDRHLDRKLSLTHQNLSMLVAVLAIIVSIIAIFK